MAEINIYLLSSFGSLQATVSKLELHILLYKVFLLNKLRSDYVLGFSIDLFLVVVSVITVASAIVVSGIISTLSSLVIFLWSLV